MALHEEFDLSTPEGRDARGIYDAEIDTYITDEIREHVAQFVKERGIIFDEPTAE